MASPVPVTSEIEDFINAQVESIDKFLLNAYGTVYKLIQKIVVYKRRERNINERGEELIAKTLTSDLWSVLDYCCMVLYCHVNHEKPSPQFARDNIKFPCNFDKKIDTMEKLQAWERKCLENMVFIGKKNYRGVFDHVQYIPKLPKEETKRLQAEQKIPEKVKTFYRLHFLKISCGWGENALSKVKQRILYAPA